MCHLPLSHAPPHRAEVQRRAAPALLSGSDAVIASETGSGKTAAFLLPSLSRIAYPPEVYPYDMKGPQLLVLVPTFELGTQVALLVYKLYGGNISTRRPGDPANLFNYMGPRGIKVMQRLEGAQGGGCRRQYWRLQPCMKMLACFHSWSRHHFILHCAAFRSGACSLTMTSMQPSGSRGGLQVGCSTRSGDWQLQVYILHAAQPRMGTSEIHYPLGFVHIPYTPISTPRRPRDCRHAATHTARRNMRAALPGHLRAASCGCRRGGRGAKAAANTYAGSQENTGAVVDHMPCGVVAAPAHGWLQQCFVTMGLSEGTKILLSPSLHRQLMRAYPSSFRAVMDLVAGNGLAGAEIGGSQVVPPTPWMLRRRQVQAAEPNIPQGDQPPQPMGECAEGAAPPPAAASNTDSGRDSRRSSNNSSSSSSTSTSTGTGNTSSGGSSGNTSSGGGESTRSDQPAAARDMQADAVATYASAGAAGWKLGDKVQVVLVGATVTESEVEEAVARHWVSEPVIVRVGAPGSVPKGLRHRALLVNDATRRLAALVAMLRRDLAQAGQDEEPARVRRSGVMCGAVCCTRHRTALGA